MNTREINRERLVNILSNVSCAVLPWPKKIPIDKSQYENDTKAIVVLGFEGNSIAFGFYETNSNDGKGLPESSDYYLEGYFLLDTEMMVRNQEKLMDLFGEDNFYFILRMGGAEGLLL